MNLLWRLRLEKFHGVWNRKGYGGSAQKNIGWLAPEIVNLDFQEPGVRGRQLLEPQQQLDVEAL
jgi:hypothetical protein